MNVLSELRDDVRSHKLIPGLMVGSLAGVMFVVNSLVLATLVFRGPLAPFLAQGAGMVLFGTFVMCLVIALTSGYRGTLSGSLNATAVMVATIGAKLVATITGADARTLFMTMAAMMIITALLTGLCSLMLGKFRLANLLRFIPFPVTSGLLAGVGGLLALAALAMMGGATTAGGGLSRMVESATLAKVAPGVAFFLALAFITRRCTRWSSVLVIAAGFVLATMLYHLGLFVLGVSLDEARAAGVLGMAQRIVWPSFVLGDLVWVDWSNVTVQLPHIATVPLVMLVSLLVRVTGLEGVGLGLELDLDREFLVAGAAGALASLGGSLPGCHSLSSSLIARRLGADTRLTGIVAALIVASVLFLGIRILALVPLPLLGGLLLLFAVDLLKTSLIDLFKRVTLADYSIVLLTFAAVVFFGFLLGVGVGIAVTTVFFAIRLSRADLIAAMATGRELRSRKVRSIPDRAILHDQGSSVRVYRLRGHIFFGSAHPVVRRIRQTLRDAPPPACILLDFSMVSGFDVAAVSVLCEFIRSAHAQGTRVVICAASRLFRDDLERMLGADSGELVRFEEDPDRGLEWCENRIIGAVGRDPEAFGGLLERVGEAMERHLDRQASFEELVEELGPWLEPRTYGSGETLSGRPDAEGLQLLVAGRVSAYDADGVRLSQHGPGHPVDTEAAFGAPARPIATRAEGPCRTVLLTPVANRLLEEDAPELALRLSRYLITAPAQRAAEPLLAATAPQPLRLQESRTGGRVRLTAAGEPRAEPADRDRGRSNSVPVGLAVVSGIELMLEPVEGCLVDAGGGFDGGPRDAGAHQLLDGRQLAFLTAFLTAFALPHLAIDLDHLVGLVHQFSTSRNLPPYRLRKSVPVLPVPRRGRNVHHHGSGLYRQTESSRLSVDREVEESASPCFGDDARSWDDGECLPITRSAPAGVGSGPACSAFRYCLP